MEYDDDDRSLMATTYGRIASYYYLCHSTVQHFKNHLCDNMSVEDVLDVLCDATEFDQLPVRHNDGATQLLRKHIVRKTYLLI